MQIQIAWRNIWRNPRRTMIMLTAMIIGIWSMIFLGGLMRGMMVGMINNGISTLTGDIQIHAKGYRDDPSIEYFMPDLKGIEKTINKILPRGSRYTSRIRVNAIAANARHSTGVTMVGIHPVKEPGVSFIGPGAVVQGRYLVPGNNNGILIGRAMAEKFGTKTGHKIILMSENIHHDIASKAFIIKGIFKAEMQSTEKHFVFVTSSSARHMLKLAKGASEISIILPNHKGDKKIAWNLRQAIPDSYEIHTWQELLPILTSYLKMFDGFMYIWFLVIFIAMGFGIVNTTLMAVYERMKEFGLLKALGMRPWLIIRSVLLESFMLLVIGTAIGNCMGFLTIHFLSITGINLTSLSAGAEFAGLSRIIYPVLYPKDIIMANVVVIGLGLVVSLYPAVKAARFTPVEALSHE